MRITALHDGQFNCPIAGLVSNAADHEVAKALRGAHLPEEHLPITFTVLVIERQGRLTVVDTGYGDIGPPSAGRFKHGFAATGFNPAAVSRVVLSHLHPDHIGGLHPADGKRLFPNAEILIPEAEWKFWTSDEERARAPDTVKVYFDKVGRVLKPQQERIATFRAGEVSPGLTAIEAFGHTPGHMAFAIESGAETLLLMSDVTNHPAIFARNPNWQSMFDIDPVAARET
ncbi:MAG: MBL fold metallo-hydrolase, partial [Acidobacteriota bacterium]|nr:MBL fold metallo-hydrolase [Acidobacteriota bacterium]